MYLNPVLVKIHETAILESTGNAIYTHENAIYTFQKGPIVL